MGEWIENEESSRQQSNASDISSRLSIFRECRYVPIDVDDDNDDGKGEGERDGAR
jgi:hypothetical protein